MSEIYIDGCNVAKCKYTNGLYNGVYGCINLNLNPACFKNPNCYFKQLQRAKAELEQYKKSKQASYEAMQREWNAAINEYRKIILENEKLKKEVETWSYQAEKRAEIGDVWYDTALKYKQALEEVAKYCNKCNLKADYTACEVLKIINEVLND